MASMNELNGKPGELRFTIQVKRAATGKIDTYDMVGKVTDDGGNALDGSTKRRD